MDTKKFKELENQYRILKMRLEMGEITSDDLKQGLKKMMLVDENNQYWMIGGKTGKWYRHDGSKWNLDDPFAAEAAASGDAHGAAAAPSLNVTPQAMEPIILGEPLKEAKIEETPTPAMKELEKTAPCVFCHSLIPLHASYCPFCGGGQKGDQPAAEAKKGGGDLLVRRVRVLSLIFFLGGVGLIFGVIFGALFGIFPILGDAIYNFPLMLQETRGKIQGGLIFGAIGGAGGFIAFAVLAFICGWLYNVAAFVFGGVRFRVKQ